MFNWNTGELQLPNITITRNTMLQDVVNAFCSDVRIFVREPNLVTYFKRAIDIGEGLLLHEFVFSQKGKLKAIVFWHKDIPDDVPVTEWMLQPIQEQIAAYPVSSWGTITLDGAHQVVVTLK